MSVRLLVTGSAVLLTVASVLSVGWVSERNARDALTRELETRLLLQARGLAASSASALLGDYPELTLHPLVKKLTAEQPELGLVAVVDHSGVVQGHADARLLGSPFVPPRGLEPVATRRRLESGEALYSNGRLMVVGTPIRQSDGREIGKVLVGLQGAYVDRTVGAARRQQGIVLALLLAGGVLIAFTLMSHLLRPMATLRAGLERIGRGDLETPIEVTDRTELGLLADSVNDMAKDLRRAQGEMLERERLAHEVELAREVQRSLLPARPLIMPGAAIYGKQRPAAEVAGDFYDIRPLADGRVAVAIADVAGKGLAGCLVMAMLSALLRALREVQSSPSAMLVALDERLAESLQPGVFVTIFYAVLSPTTGELTCASAGHNPTLVYRRSTGLVARIGSRGIPLGAMRGGLIRETLRDETVRLEPGDLLVQYTDGYTEAFAPGGQDQFGLARIEEIVVANGAAGGEAVIAALDAAIERWTQGGPPSDDQTLLVVGCAGASGERPHVSAEAAPAASLGQDRAVERLVEAERRGHRLELGADLGSLVAIEDWIKRVPVLKELHGATADLLRNALYEMCANIAEHGCGSDPRRTFEMWWLPPAGIETRDGRAMAADRRNEDPVREGCFVIRDDGKPFRPENWNWTDFNDPRAWRRGRGLGLDIIHRVMREVAYHPGTPRGNITILAFGPRSGTRVEEGASR